jgi:hypothetical protein
MTLKTLKSPCESSESFEGLDLTDNRPLRDLRPG